MATKKRVEIIQKMIKAIKKSKKKIERKRNKGNNLHKIKIKQKNCQKKEKRKKIIRK